LFDTRLIIGLKERIDIKTYCEGEKTRLRLVRLKDAPLIARWKKEAYLRRMALSRVTRITLSEQRDDIRQAVESPNQLYLIIEKKETRTPAGYVRINWIDDENRFAWLRFAIGDDRFRRKGLMRDALKSLLSWLFEKGMRRVDAEVYDFNKPSLALLEGLGFMREGLKRKALFDGKDYHDVVVLGLLRSDWE